MVVLDRGRETTLPPLTLDVDVLRFLPADEEAASLSPCCQRPILCQGLAHHHAHPPVPFAQIVVFLAIFDDLKAVFVAERVSDSVLPPGRVPK
jgi:hypothetical protein